MRNRELSKFELKGSNKGETKLSEIRAWNTEVKDKKRGTRKHSDLI